MASLYSSNSNKTMQLFSFHQFLILTACLSLICLVANSKAELQHFQQQAKTDGSLSFLVVGDWGRRGLYNQSQVATQMGIIGEKADINLVISTGDNFYDDGLTGPEDPALNESFTNIYTAPSLQRPWYIVLGNHDYRGDALAQLKIARRWFCSRPLFILYADDYFTDPKEHVYDWRGVLPREDYLSKLFKDLDITLKNSSAKWKIVVGHHTIRSAGHHGNTTYLVSHLLPILKANNVDFYINGHDHFLEHISDADSKIEFFTSGGGSKAWRGDIKWWSPEELKLYYDGQGFMSVKMTKTTADILF